MVLDSPICGTLLKLAHVCLSGAVAASGCGAVSAYEDEKRKERHIVFSNFLFPTQCELLAWKLHVVIV